MFQDIGQCLKSVKQLAISNAEHARGMQIVSASIKELPTEVSFLKLTKKGIFKLKQTIVKLYTIMQTQNGERNNCVKYSTAKYERAKFANNNRATSNRKKTRANLVTYYNGAKHNFVAM